MNEEQIKTLESHLGSISQMADMIGRIAGLMKLVIAMGVAVVVSIASVAVWVESTTKGLAQAQRGLVNLEEKRDRQLAEWTVWRSSNDKTVERLTVIAENHQRLIERQQAVMERQQVQLERIVR